MLSLHSSHRQTRKSTTSYRFNPRNIETVPKNLYISFRLQVDAFLEPHSVVETRPRKHGQTPYQREAHDRPHQHLGYLSSRKDTAGPSPSLSRNPARTRLPFYGEYRGHITSKLRSYPYTINDKYRLVSFLQIVY